MRLLVTGGMGFIGSNFVRHALAHHPDWEVINLDALTYAGNPENLTDVVAAYGGVRYWFAHGSIGDPDLVAAITAGRVPALAALQIWHPSPPPAGRPVDVVVNFAAESHVDRSILDAAPFLETNVRGTHVVLEAARRQGVGRVVQVSTDEVYGPAPPGVEFDEQAPLNPSSPYAASKAAADLLCLAYVRTYGTPVVIARCTNNYGPYQYPEKFIPLVITNALDERPVPIYGDGLQVRDWLFVEDHCEALCALVRAGEPGEIYNIAGGTDLPNLEVAHRILRMLGKSEALLELAPDRPGHDRRYALRADKIRSWLDWRPQNDFEQGLAATVDWYRSHEDWWRRLKSGAFQQYYEQWYGGILRETRTRPATS